MKMKSRVFLVCFLILQLSLFQNCGGNQGLAPLSQEESSLSANVVQPKKDAVPDAPTPSPTPSQDLVSDGLRLKVAQMSFEQQIAFGIVDLGSADIGGLRLVPCDSFSASDNKKFLEAVFAKAGLKNMTYLFPPNASYCTSTLSISNASGVTIAGSGDAATKSRLVLKASSKQLFLIGQNVQFLTISDLRIAAEVPTTASKLFSLRKCANCMMSRIDAEEIYEFATIQDTNNVTFEDINIKVANGPRVFEIAPDAASLDIKSDVISFFRIRGEALNGGGAWVFAGNAASFNFHEIEFVGGKYGFYAPPDMKNSFRYLSGQNIVLRDQSIDGMHFESGLGIQFAGVRISNCQGVGIAIGNQFIAQAQLHDIEVTGCGKAGIRVSSTRLVNIINPKIQGGGASSAGIVLGAGLTDLNIRGGTITGVQNHVVRLTSMPTSVQATLINQSAWSPSVYDYGPGITTLFQRRSLGRTGPFVLFQAGTDTELQSAINDLCSTGGVLVIGRQSVILNDAVRIASTCRPIEIRGSSRSMSVKFSLMNDKAQVVLMGQGHALRDLTLSGEGKVLPASAIVISEGDSILLERLSILNAKNAVAVTDSKNLSFYYNRYTGLTGISGVHLYGTADKPINGVRMLMETAYCDWETMASCRAMSSLKIVGNVTNLEGVQSAYIRGGIGTHAVSLSSTVRPGFLSFFGMGADHPYQSGGSFANVSFLRVDFPWLGQTLGVALKIQGTNSQDKAILNGVMLHTRGKPTLDSSQAKTGVMIRGGIFRIAKPLLGSNANSTSVLFDDGKSD